MSALLSVIIPCFNEEKTILRVLKMVHEMPHAHKEVVVVDDFSTDGTRELLATPELSRYYDKLILQDANYGKGRAIRAGISVISGDIMIVQDADLEYDPNEIPAVIAPIIQGKADVSYGSRFIGAGPHRVLYFWHRMGNFLLTFLSNMMTDLNLTDMETCYKAMSKKVYSSLILKEDRFGFEPEITAKIAKSHYRIYEVGISYHGRTYAEGKKIGWRDGLRAVYCIIKYRLV